jgi:hypothetical protein
MSNPVPIARDINSALEQRLDPASPFIYDHVVILLLYWKDADLDFKRKADALEHLFRTKLLYTAVLRFEIPSSNSNIALRHEIHRVCLKLNIPRHAVLCIRLMRAHKIKMNLHPQHEQTSSGAGYK